MPEYKVFEDPVKAAILDKDGFPVDCLSFTIDGQETLKWFKKCRVEGLPEDYYVQRCINRLKAGRSEVFGGLQVSMGGQVVTTAARPKLNPGALETVRAYLYQQGHSPTDVERLLTQTRAPGTPRTARVFHEEPAARPAAESRPPRPRWRFELDGKCCEETYPTEAAAREACACRAFLTRSKLGRLKEAEEAFARQHEQGCPCEVKVEGGRIIAVAADGTRHAVGFTADGVKFKPLQ